RFATKPIGKQGLLHMSKARKSSRAVSGRRLRNIGLGILLSLVIIAGYGWFLTTQEVRVRSYLADLRKNDPNAYLVRIKQIAGFNEFLDEYRVIEGFQQPRSAAPSFLLGRWSLTDTAKRVSDKYTVDNCVNPLLVENGRITLPGDSAARTPVTYELRNQKVTVMLPDGKTMPIRLISFGVNLHHLELVLPGSDKTFFGYACK
ncbi:MAG: hypothetical protein Q9M41_05675, partial [Paracoccaceae bacterium]|nr:hypothetical protein [Paracoccaceae bacterium]